MTVYRPLAGMDAGGMPVRRGLYDPWLEHDACGVGFIARLDDKRDHALVRDAVQILINLEHRGAVGADRSTGDGAGLLLQMPDGFLRAECDRLGLALPREGRYAVAMVFLPGDEALARRCVGAFEGHVRREGGRMLGWRETPLNSSGLGTLARTTLPRIRQAFVACGDIPGEAVERRLYTIRRQVEKEVAAWRDADFGAFHICSLSSRTLIYKGMLTGAQLTTFYPDLNDENFGASYAVIHQRYSTNTFPTWRLAQPFRMLAHNGEINTLRGNINCMRAREGAMAADLLGDDIRKLTPIVDEAGSDSAIFDNVLELLVMAGRSLPHAMMMMVPEAWGARYHMSVDKRAFYEYHAAIMEPWDGPAALVCCDGRYIGGTLDRNGLRPCRYTITSDGIVVLASETGVLEFPEEHIVQRGRLQPGKMLLVDLEHRRIVPDNEIKARIARQQPYRRWVKHNRIELRGLFTPARAPAMDPGMLRRQQHAFGYTAEDLTMILSPMASRSQEPVGSMGNDAALAVLSRRPQSLFSYFKQRFAQVTNPPIDPYREELVMSLMSFIGRERNLLDEEPEHCRRLKIPHPILTPDDMAVLRHSSHPDLGTVSIAILFPRNGGPAALEAALETVLADAEKAVRQGAALLILTDAAVDADHAPIPVLLAVAATHHHLIRQGLRTRAAILAETGEAREIMHFALLLGYGANAVCPALAFATVREMADGGLLAEPLAPEDAMDNYITAVKKGLLKTLSRLGISTIRSYVGAQTFEAVGLGHDVAGRYFAQTPSRLGGAGLADLARDAIQRHLRGFPERGAPDALLDCGGAYHLRAGGERHLWSPEAIYKLQAAVRQGDYGLFKRYSRLIDDQGQEPVTLRSLLRFRAGDSVPLDEVEPVDSIVTRFVTSAMSFGSISQEAHETIAIAANRLHAASNSGEGGEDSARYAPQPGGASRRSRIKQVASGRFGVTIEYLVNADELQIKIAQGAKPGEGGQLPSHKVSPDIARVRHTIPGVTLISPPPHHDIYSIEDLAQLIADLKAANPKARISVKLVSEAGVGMVAAGVAKAKADMVLISGHDGGTGASPLTSIKHAGIPWELGLAETQQALVANGLRGRIRIQTDGQLRTGRDLAIAALLGAEEFGFGTVILVTLGCVMIRKCHLDTCPTGVATQNPKLRQRFQGRPEHVVNFLCFVAQELREWMAELGFRAVDDMVGRVDRLDVDPQAAHGKARTLDLRPLLEMPQSVTGPTVLRCVQPREHGPEGTLNAFLVQEALPALQDGTAVSITMPIRNTDRAAGATLSGEIARRYGAAGLRDDTVRIAFRGSAGQSLGAFLAPGITMRVEGDANDYVGKGMSGGRIILAPPARARFIPHENIIAGNTVLYGATGGEMYIHGVAGERFAVRNSGAVAVVEGVGDHACEYMTGGVVVVLGPTGNNFAAGMSGGVAYVFDESQLFDTRCNFDMVNLESVWEIEDRSQLRRLVENHCLYTRSTHARAILDNWEARLPLFVRVMPIDYRRARDRMRLEEFRGAETVSVTEEVYRG